MAYLVSELGMEMLEDVGRFCKDEIWAQCREWDMTGQWPREVYEKAFDMGYQTLDIPESYGGPGLDMIDAAALLEQIAMADAGIAVTLAASNLGLKPIMLAGTEAQKQRACSLIINGGLGAFCLTEPQAGSDAGAVQTTAVREETVDPTNAVWEETVDPTDAVHEGDVDRMTAVREDGVYILNGRKTFITNGSVAAFYCVAAMTDSDKGTRGMTMFFVEADNPGVTAENHENKMGIRTSDTCDVVFDNCRIPVSSRIGAEGGGFAIAMAALDQGRAWMGCVAVGIAQRALEEAVSYGKKRCQFGKPILKNQALRFKIADMAMKTETARQMTAHALTLIGQGQPCTAQAAMAKCYASDIAMEVASEAIQVFGGYGYSREYPVEKLLRDAKIFQIFEGTNEIQRMVIASEVLLRN